MNTSEWNWPEWVPPSVRAVVENFYTFHGGADGWRKLARDYHAPELGQTIRLPELGKKMDELCREGRFVYCWGNIGRVVHDDGSYSYVSFHEKYQPSSAA